MNPDALVGGTPIPRLAAFASSRTRLSAWLRGALWDAPTGMKKRPRFVQAGPQCFICKDEVWRYGCEQKPIQNPYGHEKTGHFKAPQETSRYNSKSGAALGTQEVRNSKEHQQTTGNNKPLGFGKDEVPSSNLGSSSTKLLKSLDFGSFCSVIRQNNEGQKVGQPL